VEKCRGKRRKVSVSEDDTLLLKECYTYIIYSIWITPEFVPPPELNSTFSRCRNIM